MADDKLLSEVPSVFIIFLSDRASTNLRPTDPSAKLKFEQNQDASIGFD